MIREIVLDTETTGVNPNNGDRIVEIGCVELVNHVPSGKFFHEYMNPERSMPVEAFNVHGLSEEFLSDKPLFADIADKFLEFVGDAQLVIHNAAFDMGFLNAELKRINRPLLPQDRAIDTLLMARRKHPGAQNSLDALCSRYGIDNTKRTKHGALLDSEILAEVYLELIGGKQRGFDLAVTAARRSNSEGKSGNPETNHYNRQKQYTPFLTKEEQQSHETLIMKLGEKAIWRDYVRLKEET